MRVSEMNAHQYVRFLDAIHKEADLDKHFDIQFGQSYVGDLKYDVLYRACIEKSGTSVEGWKMLRRALRGLNLSRYFNTTIGLDGLVAECGVLQGFSTLMLATVQASQQPGFAGEGFHLVDSFDGLSQPTEPDALGYKPPAVAGGAPEVVYAHKKGDIYSSIEHTKATLADYPEMAYHKGWIPEVFASLPEAKWSFVHIDVDLYDPTMACLNYFLPRLVKGGCIVNDDFDSPLFPGGGVAWQEFFDAQKLPYVVLDSGQSVYVMA
jgi:O-methyltransferase